MSKIGEFSKLVRVSPRMLRHYEKCGLLNPAKLMHIQDTISMVLNKFPS
jgi:hypothetical protein